MPTLKAKHKEFIIQQLASYQRPSDVIELVKENFNVELKSNQVAYYDPTTVQGKELAKKWKDLFYSIREDFRRSEASVPIANKNYRLAELQDMFDTMRRAGNVAMSLRILEQAREEVEGKSEEGDGKGNFFTQINNYYTERLG